MKTSLGIASLFLIICSCTLPHRTQYNTSSVTQSERAEAIGLIQGDTGRGNFISEDDIVPVARALRLVRQYFPEGADIVSQSRSRLSLQLTDSAALVMQRSFPAGWLGDTVLHSLPLRAIDSVNVALGVSTFSVHAIAFVRRSLWFVSPSFPRPIYTNAIFDRYHGVSGVRFTTFDPTSVGGGDVLNLARKGHLYTFGFSRRWGDCPAGCIHAHHWIFEVNMQTGDVRKLREYGDPWPITPAT